ncbi:uncharacterized protein SAPINGB_P001931 [Magnusiomyces paraingens]|uniref:CoA-binding domain-containing protein n=1 Tax=Magnusiomyces paraingens TaxID=2606893 RepID=A0A5E8BGX7_9ASCO|nr:uncharacterized protein SAPINGB_P001931 [Saprochaete ingens]VVT48747.1 unnamed protein product [Saprochaete ingens]
MISSQAAMESFFRPHRLYAVAGASADPTKFGNKILAWYLHRQLPVAGINPKSPTILEQPTYSSLDSVYSQVFEKSSTDSDKFSSIAISVVTPPKASLALVEHIGQTPALRKAVRAMWFQPGTFDDATLDAAQNAGIKTIIAHDRCVLVQGQESLDAARRSSAWSEESSSPETKL